ncbi:hypothetical protein NUU61_003253 [Penicillium alfredii]|uniref:Uncharacterized protein n=1 Tax=Penicillium alfredii TaxID=1506179 RepID=A0A9W9FT06_9EURO|nr:uncharacterized protein NUU61_003253 [Penicillium alfredii]KAJ5105906.1 hypothetical protein NUU61_003253 [Penicillium alfredii]
MGDINNWRPIGGTQWSTMELSVSFNKWSSVSKIYQTCGRLEDARFYPDHCYPFIQSEHLRADPIRFQIICRFADLLCAEGRCAKARSIIESEIQSVSNHNHGKLAKALRRLKVSLVDVDIAEGKYDQASLNVEWLKQQFIRVPSPDISDQWLHVRAIVASARLLHSQCRLQDILREWEKVLLLLKQYSDTFKPEGVFYSLGQLSVSLARIQSAYFTDNDRSIASETWRADARQIFDKGCAVLVHEIINYWVPILPKTVIPDILSRLESAEPS